MMNFDQFLNRLLWSESLTREQWHEFWSGSGPRCGHKLFAIGMLRAAWEDACLRPTNRQEKLDRLSAINWLRGSPPGRYPLVYCCDLLRIDADWFSRGALLRIRDLQVRGPRVTIESVTPSPITPSRAVNRAARLAELQLPESRTRENPTLQALRQGQAHLVVPAGSLREVRPLPHLQGLPAGDGQEVATRKHGLGGRQAARM